MHTFICINVESPSTLQQHKVIDSYTHIRKVSCIYGTHIHILDTYIHILRAHSEPKVSTVALPQRQKTDSSNTQYWQYTQHTVETVAECLKFSLGVRYLSTILHKLEPNFYVHIFSERECFFFFYIYWYLETLLW